MVAVVSMDTIVNVVICIIGIVMTGMIPWARQIERRLAGIEAGVGQQLTAALTQLKDLGDRVHELELDKARREGAEGES